MLHYLVALWTWKLLVRVESTHMFAYAVVVVESLMTLWAFVDTIDCMGGSVNLTTGGSIY